MADFERKYMPGSRFCDVHLGGSQFHQVDLSGSLFQDVDLAGVTIKGANATNVEISGYVENVRINGIDVVPLIDAELDRRYPERAKLKPSDPAGFREAWATIEQLWAPTVERARRLSPELLHERVDGEWSFIETMRHLVFATDAWVKRTILGDEAPYDAVDLPHSEMGEIEGVPNDPDARPTLDDVLALRADRISVVRDLIAKLTDEALASHTAPNPAPGYPASDSYVVADCLRIVLDEEWAHRMYAERDLDALEARAMAGTEK